ncbi:MAG: ABC transporter permease [Thermoleophilia bacterium]|nr:ABC transporter permease [Thermoleophilia bacterium]
MTTFEHAPDTAAAGPVRARGFSELAWMRFKRDRLAVASLVFIAVLLVSAFIVPSIASRLLGHNPEDIFAGGLDADTQLPVGPWTWVDEAPYPGAECPNGPCGTTLFILGGDSQLGRDLFLRMLYGAQTSLEVALLAVFFTTLFGVVMGLLAGYLRGWVDTIISRLTDMMMVFPTLLLLIAVQTTVGPQLNRVTLGFLSPGVFTLVLIFSLFGWFYPARIVRGQVLSLREKEFIEAARMTGASDLRIMRSHLLPHLVAPIVVLSTLAVASYIIGEAGLSFLGVGILPPTASWGNLLAEAPKYYLVQPWIMVWPGLAILFTTLAFNLLGDALRDAFDPRSML